MIHQVDRRTGLDQGFAVTVDSSAENDDDYGSSGAKQLFEFHAGAVTAMDVSPLDHFAATGGEDGTVS